MTGEERAELERILSDLITMSERIAALLKGGGDDDQGGDGDAGEIVPLDDDIEEDPDARWRRTFIEMTPEQRAEVMKSTLPIPIRKPGPDFSG